MINLSPLMRKRNLIIWVYFVLFYGRFNFAICTYIDYLIWRKEMNIKGKDQKANRLISIGTWLVILISWYVFTTIKQSGSMMLPSPTEVVSAFSVILKADVMFVGIIIMGLFGVLMDSGLKYLENKIVFWKGKD